MTAAKLLVARENFMAATKDGEVFVNVGQVFPARDPLVKAHAHLFEAAEPKPAPVQPRRTPK